MSGIETNSEKKPKFEDLIRHVQYESNSKLEVAALVERYQVALAETSDIRVSDLLQQCTIRSPQHGKMGHMPLPPLSCQAAPCSTPNFHHVEDGYFNSNILFENLV